MPIDTDSMEEYTQKSFQWIEDWVKAKNRKKYMKDFVKGAEVPPQKK
jgi:hypothetical protein